MNTTDYFTNINAMFLFCIFTCGLLLAVGWKLSRKSDKLKKEQDSHLKATKINSLLTKENKEIDDKLAQAEHKLRYAEKEVRELQAKLDHAEADRIELRAERATLENKLTDALAKVRKRDKDGKFLPSGNARPKRVKKVDDEKSYIKEANKAMDKLNDAFGKIKELAAAQPKLTHGLTVKNPTEDEAKMIFDEARRLGVDKFGIEIDETTISGSGDYMPHIWYTESRDYQPSICRRIAVLQHSRDDEQVVTAKEFVQRMQNGRG